MIRLIVRADIKGPNVVKTVHTEGLRVVGEPREMLTRYYQEGADEILYMDIVASLYQRNLDFEQLKRSSSEVFIPITVGGGIRSLHDIENALRAGADKVAINTYAVHRPEFITEAAERFGSQCIVLSVEAKKISSGRYEAYTDGGREKSGKDALEWIKEGVERGAGEVLITSIDRDGTKKGYDFELTKIAADSVSVPVIAHGGAGKPEDIEQLLRETGIETVSASSIFHYRAHSLGEVKSLLSKSGFETRTI